MEWNVKLKSGIFMTQEYILLVEDSRIMLRNKMNAKDSHVFLYEQINTLTFISKNEGFELEMNLDRGIYLVIFSKDMDLNELISVFKSNFGKKVSLI